MDQIVVAVPLVPLLDDPVPQTVDTVLDFFRSLDLSVAEQVIAVPKISFDCVSQRLGGAASPSDGGTVGGSADRAVSDADRLADRGADRRHSSSSWSWRAVSSRFSLPDRVQRRFRPQSAFLSELWSRPLVFLLVVVCAVFKVFPQDRLLQRFILNEFLSRLWSKTSTFLVEVVFKVSHKTEFSSAPDPLVWSAGALNKRRRLVFAVRDRAFLPGSPGIWNSEWFQVPAAVVCADDIALWPYTTGLLVKWVSFLGSLHWPAGGLDLGVCGVMLNCFFFMNFGLVRGSLWRRLIHSIFDQGVQFQCLLFRLVQALIFGVHVVLLVL